MAIPAASFPYPFSYNSTTGFFVRLPLSGMETIYSSAVSSQLFYCSSSKCIASSNQYTTLILDRPETNFGQVGRFSNAIHSTKSNYIRSFVSFCFQNITNNVNSSLRSQELNQRLIKSIFDSSMNR